MINTPQDAVERVKRYLAAFKSFSDSKPMIPIYGDAITLGDLRTLLSLTKPNEEMVVKVRTALLDAKLARLNWQKYNSEQGDELVYQAEKMASAIDAALDASATAKALDGASDPA